MKIDSVFVIGLDGATFDLLFPLINKGIMPNLKRIIEKGTWGNLISPIPPITPASWTSFFTGVNPGKHRIFGFIKDKYIPDKRCYINSTHIKAKKIWQILTETGLSSGIINVPITYPPDKLNGYMISGFPTPYNPKNYTYPSNLEKEIKKIVGKYIIDVQVSSTPEKDKEVYEIIEKIYYALSQRQKAILYLIKNYPTNFTTIVYETPDRLQHLFWKYIDEKNELYKSKKAKKYRKKILECYEYLDKCIGDILNNLSENSTLILISDHGFGPIEKNIFMNNWLYLHGFLKIKIPIFIWQKIRRRLFKLIGKKHLKNIWKDELYFIDWPNTLAYSGDIFEQGIFINLKGREPYGIVEPGNEYENIRKEIKDALQKSVDPITKEPFVDAVYFKEEVYKGKDLMDAPDLFVIMKNYAYIIVNGFNFHNFINRTFLVDNKKPSGFHRLDGIFIAYGKNIKEGQKLKTIKMEDVAPTILYLLGVPIPKNMDGKPCIQMCKENFLTSTSIHWTEDTVQTIKKEEKIYSDNEEEEIQKQLKGLGYF